MSYQLRSYQQEAVDRAMEHIRKSTEPSVLELATGSGKSLVVADIAKQLYAVSGGKRVLCLQPSAELTKQNFEKYAMTGEKASIYSASISKSLRHPVIYATPGTFKSQAKRMGHEFTAVIYDECHKISPTIINIIKEMKEGNPNLRVLGLTATPYRLGEGFIYEIDDNDKIVTAVKNPYYKKLLFRVTEPQLVELGFLTPPLIGAEIDSYDTSSLTMKGNKFTHESVMQTFEGHGRLTSKIVADVVHRSYGRRGVMFFGASIEHCLEIIASLPPEQTRMVTGETNKQERKKIIADFKAQKFRYLVSKDVLTTGFDAPHVDVIAILRATESHALFTQIRGRGARLFDDKPNYLLLDYGNNIDRLYPDGDIYNPTIDIPAPESESFGVTVYCPECNKENLFSARPNDDGLEMDRDGYFIDLDGNRIETEDGPIPAHYGRRCQNVNRKLERCDYYWTCKECEVCHHKNDIAARRCEACRHEFIDPNEKLDLEFKRLKRSPNEWQTDEVISWRAIERKSKNGNEMYVVDVQTEYRMVVFYVVKNSDKVWVKKQQELFEHVTKNGATPRTITYKKQENGLWTVKDYNLPTDEEIYKARLESIND